MVIFRLALPLIYLSVAGLLLFHNFSIGGNKTQQERVLRRYDPKTVTIKTQLSGKPAKRHSCPSRKGADKTEILSVFFDTLEILNQVGCPYHITAGTLLGFVRECRLWSDIDISIPLEWWKQPDNAKALQNAMSQGDQYRNTISFGTPGELGYEQSWMRKHTQVDFFSTITYPNYFVFTLWVKNLMYPCVIDRLDVQEFQWGNITIRAPTPFDSVLQSYYGKDWSQPMVKWVWNSHAFTIGSCTKDPSRRQELLELYTV